VLDGLMRELGFDGSSLDSLIGGAVAIENKSVPAPQSAPSKVKSVAKPQSDAKDD
jgi:hypothetical protein